MPFDGLARLNRAAVASSGPFVLRPYFRIRRRWRSRGSANAKPTTSTLAPTFHVAAHSSSHGDCPP